MAVLLVLRRLGDHDLGREQQPGHRGGILQRQPRHLGRVQDTLLEHVAELAGSGVVPEGALAFLDAVEDHRGVLAGVVDDLAQRLLDRARENADADRLVLIRRLELVEHLLHTDMLAFSSDRPTSSEMTVPPVRVAMSCSMALRRSPKPGALTPATLRMPRMLLTTRVASASPSTSSATTSSGRPALATPSSSGSSSRMLEIFLSTSRITGFSSSAVWFCWLLMKYGDR